MSGANARQDSNSKVIESTFQPAFIMETSEKKNARRILHVDDDLGFLEVSKQILLMENNFEIDNVESVDDAFKKIEHQTYDAVVSDYEMPQKNGLEFLQKLREQNNQITFILFTGKGREDVAVKALNLGADSYINKNGSPETVYCELADAINKTLERKKSRELLAKSESKYHALVENSLQGISILLAAPLSIVFANGAFGKILGYSSQELTSLSPEGIMGLVYHEDRAVFFKRMEDRLRGEVAEACYEFRAVRKDGSLIWLSSLANRVDYDGQPAVQGMFLDVNESKIAAEILRESEQRYRELANCLPNIVFETDLNGQLVFANERAAEISGYSFNDIKKGLNILQFIVPEDREKATKSIQRLLSGGSYTPTEYTFVRKDGTTFPALVTAAPRISGNKITGLSGLVIDLTERKKAEDKILAASLYSRSLLEASLDPLVTISKEGKITDVNQATEDVTGCSREELIGSDFSTYFTESEQARTGYRKVFTEGLVKDYPLAIKHRSGRITNVLYNATIYRNPQGEIQGVFAAARDITERKKAEEALSRERNKLESVTAASGVGLVIVSKDYHVLWANNFIKRYKGETIGKLCYATLNSLDVPCQDCGVTKIYAGKTTLDSHEYCSTTVDGNPYWAEIVATPITDEKGNVTSAVEICVDITERKKNEEELKESIHKNELINEKLSVVGSLTRHDVGNKLMVMKSNMYLLKKQVGDNPKLAKYLEGIDSAIKQSDEMFEFSRYYEKIGVEKPSKTDVAQCFNQAAMLLPSLGTIKIVNDCQGLEVMADSLLKQLFYNFLDNSLKHGEKVTQIQLHFTKECGGVKLFYEDNGVGIPEANKPKLFHEGFSTGKSTGLGLFLIKKMVEAYGWSITEEGELGKGAKFVISVPTSVFENQHALENQSAN
jgi:PAS domain S-box-containing protein